MVKPAARATFLAGSSRARRVTRRSSWQRRRGTRRSRGRRVGQVNRVGQVARMGEIGGLRSRVAAIGPPERADRVARLVSAGHGVEDRRVLGADAAGANVGIMPRRTCVHSGAFLSSFCNRSTPRRPERSRTIASSAPRGVRSGVSIVCERIVSRSSRCSSPGTRSLIACFNGRIVSARLLGGRGRTDDRG